MFNYLPMAATTSPHLCMQCMQIPTTTTSSSLQMTSNAHKCTCQNLVSSSSSESTISENVPIQLTLNIKTMATIPHDFSHGKQQVILVPNILPRPERLQPYPSVTTQPFLTPITDDHDDYYSCASECDQECDIKRNADIPFKNPGNLFNNFKGDEKNLVILQLLHEVVHLIQEDNPIREEAMQMIQENSKIYGHISTQTKETICVPLNQSETPRTQSSARTITETAIEVEDSKSDFKELPNGGFTSGQQQPPPQLTLPSWAPCYCYLYGMAAGQSRALPMPFPIHSSSARNHNIVQGQPIPMTVPMDHNVPIPHNCTSAFHGVAKIPQDFVYQETEVIYDECSRDLDEQITLAKPENHEQTQLRIQNELQYEEKNVDDDKCICPKMTDVCPKHGCLENIFKQPSLLCQESEICDVKTSEVKDDLQICTCPTEEDKCPIHGRVINPNKDSTGEDVNNKTSDLYKNNVPTVDYVNSQDDYHSKPIYSLEENLHQELPPHYVSANPDNNVLNPHQKNLDSNEQQDYKVLSNQPSEMVEYTTTVYHDETTVYHELPQVVQVVEPLEKSPFIVRTSATTGRNIYNFLPALENGEIEADEYYEQVGKYDSAGDYYYSDNECEEFDEECELAKEKIAERRKKKKHEKNGNDDKNKCEKISMALETLQQLENEGSPDEMKFFIDSLILDLDAMEHARRKAAIEKNLCMPRPGVCPRESFPVTITDVTDLGTTSLYVKWIIHDCCGIGGYEIYTDGYLTNRYFHCKHEAAVITNVDVALPHKIALVAQTLTDDASIELMCNQSKSKNKCKCLPWKTNFEKEKKSSTAITSALWTPSIYLYDPATCRATTAPPIMRGSI